MHQKHISPCFYIQFQFCLLPFSTTCAYLNQPVSTSNIINQSPVPSSGINLRCQKDEAESATLTCGCVANATSYDNNPSLPEYFDRRHVNMLKQITVSKYLYIFIPVDQPDCSSDRQVFMFCDVAGGETYVSWWTLQGERFVWIQTHRHTQALSACGCLLVYG